MDSTGGHTPVHDHARPDARGRLIRGQIRGHRGYLLRGYEPAVRLSTLHTSTRLLWIVVACGDAGDPGRIHCAWRDAVDPYALGDVVYGRRLRQGQDGALRGAVGSPIRDTDERRDGGYVDDRTSPRVPHGGDCVLHPEKGSLEVDGHEALPVLIGGLWRSSRNPYTRVVDHHVKATPLLEYSLHERLELFGAGNVSSAGEGLALDLAGHPCGGLTVQVGEGDQGFLAGEPDGDGLPDTGARAR